MSNVKWKNVAHLYLGCRLQGLKTGRILKNTESVLMYCDWNPELIKPILRRQFVNTQTISVADFTENLNRAIDMFGLIESGEAIDAATYEKDPYKVEVENDYKKAVYPPKEKKSKSENSDNNE